MECLGGTGGADSLPVELAEITLSLNTSIWSVNGRQIFIFSCTVADPNTSFHFYADPYPTFHFNTDLYPAPAPHQSDANLRLMVY